MVDDGSTDNTQQTVAGFTDPRITYVKQDENRGACAARNVGIKKAQGEYIAFLDSDDLWLEHKLQEQMQCLLEQGADMVFCPILIEAPPAETKVFPADEKPGFKEYQYLLRQSIGSTQTFFGKKQCFADHPFDETLPRMQDWDVLLAISRQYKVYYQATAFALVRLQGDSISKQKDKGLLAYEVIYEKHRQAIENSDLVKGLHVLLKGHLIYEAGENPKAFYNKHLALNPNRAIKYKIRGKYYLSKLGLLKWFYKIK